MLNPLSADHDVKRQDPLIVVRTISIPELDLFRILRIHDPKATGYRLYRQLLKHNPDLTPKDIAFAVREAAIPMAELWIGGVMERLLKLQPRGPQRRRRRSRASKKARRIVTINRIRQLQRELSGGAT